MRSVRVPYFRQEWENSCGIACVRMILAYFGRKISERELRDAIKLREDDLGTTPIQLEKLCKKLNHRTLLKDDASVDELKNFLKNRIPVIVLIDPGVLEDKPWIYAAHFTVVTKISKDHIYLNDPDKGRLTLDLKIFNRCWGYCDRVLLVILK